MAKCSSSPQEWTQERLTKLKEILERNIGLVFWRPLSYHHLQLGFAVRSAYTFDMRAAIDRRYDRAQEVYAAPLNSLSISLLLSGLPLAPV